MRRCVGILLLVLFEWTGGAQADTWTPDNGNGTYTNPLFYDEFSDPDMIRVGEDFYLTGTTMHSMPGLPVLHSKDLVNWNFVSYAASRLDLGPSFRLEGGANIYGQGFWAPSFRYHDGTFYIFSNVNKQSTQLFTATNPAGPWRQQSMRRSLHDLSVLFDDDGKVYVVWGYRSIQFAQLTADLTDIVPGTQREIIATDAGMGEGLHFTKIDGKYFITSAWYDGRMRMPAARADRPEGPYEVNQAISIDEDFGLAQGYRLGDMRGKAPPYDIRPGDPHALGRLSLHQGGVIQTSSGEWWGYSMMDYNSVGRLTALSPVTWKDGWPYFGLPGNLGRTPRTWVKPKTAVAQPVTVPYERDDDFSGSVLKPIWQWNHVPVENTWSLGERKGYLRLHALPATSLWDARNTLTQRSIGPRSAPSVQLDTASMRDHDVAGLALFNRPYAWLGVQRTGEKRQLIQFDEQSGRKAILDLPSQRVWLRAECDFLTEQARFSYSLDGERFVPFGEPLTMVFQLTTFQGVRYALFNYNTAGQRGGAADFDEFEVAQPAPRGLMRPIPYRERVLLSAAGQKYGLGAGEDGLVVGEPRAIKVVDMQLGRVALELGERFVTVEASGAAGLTSERPGLAETFQWIETPSGELVLMSLRTHRFLRIDPQSRRIVADSPGPRPDGADGVRWAWEKPRT
ncbi:glycoside hydrolase family 43 protein [Steroidobacter agaridevorans]|uniref:glycoside hydrolase family 43 protein n=1 Tax=Steroidobacter agaridevorans TaxID=2695856 RepID=UPI00137A024E|nr:glycoside hydrolase 43 family protein [Steroidobacter agaridevorans]